MTESDRVDRVVHLAARELSPSAEDKARHRAALRLGASARERAASGRAIGHDVEAAHGIAAHGIAAHGIAAGRAANPAGGWSALRASGRAGWTAAALLVGSGITLGFWLRGALPSASTEHAPREPAASIGTALDPSAQRPPRVASPAPAEPSVPEPSVPEPSIPLSPRTSAETVNGGGELSTEPVPRHALKQGEAATTADRAELPRARAGAKLERRATGPAATADPSFAPQPFDAELALLQRVERAMRANEYSLALALVAELDEHFPTARLEEERRAARLIAECRLGLPGSRQRGAQFLAQRPSSVYAYRVQTACTPPGADAELRAPR